MDVKIMPLRLRILCAKCMKLVHTCIHAYKHKQLISFVYIKYFKG